MLFIFHAVCPKQPENRSDIRHSLKSYEGKPLIRGNNSRKDLWDNTIQSNEMWDNNIHALFYPRKVSYWEIWRKIRG